MSKLLLSFYVGGSMTKLLLYLYKMSSVLYSRYIAMYVYNTVVKYSTVILISLHLGLDFQMEKNIYKSFICINKCVSR